MIKRMEKGSTLGGQGINILDNLKMIIGMGMGKCIGTMEPVLRGSG